MCSSIAQINVHFFGTQVRFVNYIVGQFWYSPMANVGKGISHNWTITWMLRYTFGVKRFFDKTLSFSMYRFCPTKIYIHTRHLKQFQCGKKVFIDHLPTIIVFYTISDLRPDGNRTSSFRKVFVPRIPNRYRYFRFIRNNITIIYTRKVRRNSARVKSSERLLRLLRALWPVRTNVISTAENSRRIYRARNVYDIVPLQSGRTFLRLFCLNVRVRFFSVDLENAISRLFENQFGIVETNRGVECFRLSLLERDKQPDLCIRCPNTVAVVERSDGSSPRQAPVCKKIKIKVNRIWL